ncbi:hypothetical protein [Parablautia sp. Marseille-Q6255]|uniref:hypothetical protein n=1 Tax=Parablautia sp. Marseille-Q6255 TaxID=3039593 RepID=UPI0024BC50A4|nr:hypothetical protein [Parablautia sp. Marseille-Q6255]
MGDLNTFVKKIVRELLKTDYPAMDKMHSMIARVTSVQQQGEAGHYHCYTVRVLEDNTELPNLISEQVYQKGDVVVIQFVSGIYPYIVGRWYG